MSDLSRLLGDVYEADAAAPSDADADADADGRERLSGLPDWADDDVLDKAFENWVPGPPDDAPAAERGVLTDLVNDPVVEVADIEVTGVEEADETPAGEEIVHAVSAAGPVHGPGAETPDVPARVVWERRDDDIIVGPRRKGLFRR